MPANRSLFQKTIKVDWLTYYVPQRDGIGYKRDDSFRDNWVSVRGAQYKANRKKMSHAVLMAEHWRATSDYYHAVLTGVGVGDALKWFLRWDRIVSLEEQATDS